MDPSKRQMLQKALAEAQTRQALIVVSTPAGRRIRLRHTPELSFHHDAGLEATDRVAKILREIEESDEPEAE